MDADQIKSAQEQPIIGQMDDRSPVNELAMNNNQHFDNNMLDDLNNDYEQEINPAIINDANINIDENHNNVPIASNINNI